MKNLIFILLLTLPALALSQSVTLEKMQLAENADFQKRVHGAMIKVSINVSGELPDSTKTAKATKRQSTATAILQGGFNPLLFARAILMFNTAIDETATDADIEFLVISVFDDMAGVTYKDENP